VMMYDLAGDVAIQRAELGTFLGAVDAFLDSNAVWTVETSGRELDDTTGTLTGVWSNATAQTGAGATAGQCVPDSAQVLLRWFTDAIVGGTFLRGRTYIPGLSTANILDGNLAVATVTGIQTAINNFMTATETFGIWHRPVGGAGGAFELVSTGSVWSEFAVLRRRRG